ncbi:unnamed protein product [Ectocarpus sp. 6 AP-2014]
MFRENLAPVEGAVRDAGVPGLSSAWSDRCLDSPRMARWEAGIGPFTTTAGGGGGLGRRGEGLQQVVDRLLCARRGILIVGSLIGPEERADVRHLAMTLRWPVYADVTSGLRCWSAEMGLGVGRLDQLLQDDAVKEAIAPDAVLQVGSPLTSKRVQKFISEPAATLTAPVSVICSPHVAWHDPGRGFTTRLACSTRDLAAAVDAGVSSSGVAIGRSELLALVDVSNAVERAQTRAIACAANGPVEDEAGSSSPSRPPSSPPRAAKGVAAGGGEGSEGRDCYDGVNDTSEGGRRPRAQQHQQHQRQHQPQPLTEPFVAWCVSRHIDPAAGLFLSASMPCRDVEVFADSGLGDLDGRGQEGGGSGGRRLRDVASNRGASGIDGVFSSAMGYAAGLRSAATLLIGDMATLHDLGSLHALKGLDAAGSCSVTMVCVNNGGGGIFSFLPIADARHGDAFSPLFDTPHSVDFEGVCLSMGLEYRRATTAREFRSAYLESQAGVFGGGDGEGAGTGRRRRRHFFIEAVTCREENLPVHRSLGGIGRAAALDHLLRGVRLGWEFTPAPVARTWPPSPAGVSNGSLGRGRGGGEKKKPTLLLLHGFMGSKEDWRGDFAELAAAEGHAVLNVELPGHGGGSGGGSNSDGKSTTAAAGGGQRGDDVLWTVGGECDGGGVEEGGGGGGFPGVPNSDVATDDNPRGGGGTERSGERSGVSGATETTTAQNGGGGGGGGGNLVGSAPAQRDEQPRGSSSCAAGWDNESNDDGVVPSWGLGGVFLAAEAVGAVCDAVGAGPYVMVGYSMGGRVALALAARRPRVMEGGGGLVLVSSSPGLASSSAARLSRWACDRALASRIAALGRRPTASSVAGVNIRERPAEEEARAFLDRWYAAPLWGDVRHRRPSAYSAMIDRRLSNLGFDPSHRGRDDKPGAPREMIKSDSHGGKRAILNNSSTGLRRDSGLSNWRGEGNSSEAGLRTCSGRGLRSESGDRDGKKDREGICLVPTGRGGGAGVNRSLKARELARSCLALSVARQANLWPLLRQLSDKKNTDKMGGGGGAGDKNSVLPVVYVAGELDPRYGGRCGAVGGSGTSGGGGGVHGEPQVGSANAANGTTPPPSFPSEQGGAAGGGGCGADISGVVKGTSVTEIGRVAGAGVGCAALASAAVVPGARTVAQAVEEACPGLSLCKLTERRGVLVRLEALLPRSPETGVGREQEEGRRVWGVGEVTPLPADGGSGGGDGRTPKELGSPPPPPPPPPPLAAVAAAAAAAAAAVTTPPVASSATAAATTTTTSATATATATATHPEGSSAETTAETTTATSTTRSSPSRLLPTVRCGIEMAVVHLVARAAGVSVGAAVSAASGLPCRGAVEINGLATRGEGVATGGSTEAGPRVLKVKVGGIGGPSEDAARTVQLLRESGGGVARGTEGGEGVEGVDLSLVEYIEEPLREPRSLGKFWERSGGIVPYALDESLAMGREKFTDKELLQLEGCAAFVVKVSVVGGLSRSARLCGLAQRLGAEAVLSSAFETGVGLAHASILASCFTTPGVAHGLSTYSRLQGDVATPGFASTVSGGKVDTLACEELLDRVAMRWDGAGV